MTQVLSGGVVDIIRVGETDHGREVRQDTPAQVVELDDSSFLPIAIPPATGTLHLRVSSVGGRSRLDAGSRVEIDVTGNKGDVGVIGAGKACHVHDDEVIPSGRRRREVGGKGQRPTHWRDGTLDERIQTAVPGAVSIGVLPERSVGDIPVRHAIGRREADVNLGDIHDAGPGQLELVEDDIDHVRRRGELIDNLFAVGIGEGHKRNVGQGRRSRKGHCGGWCRRSGAHDHLGRRILDADLDGLANRRPRAHVEHHIHHHRRRGADSDRAREGGRPVRGAESIGVRRTELRLPPP